MLAKFANWIFSKTTFKMNNFNSTRFVYFFVQYNFLMSILLVTFERMQKEEILLHVVRPCKHCRSDVFDNNTFQRHAVYIIYTIKICVKVTNLCILESCSLIVIHIHSVIRLLYGNEIPTFIYKVISLRLKV